MEIKIYRNKKTQQLECWPYEIKSDDLEFLGNSDSKQINFACSIEVDQANHLEDLINTAIESEMPDEFVAALKNDCTVQNRAIQLYEKFLSNDDSWKTNCQEALTLVAKEPRI